MAGPFRKCTMFYRCYRRSGYYADVYCIAARRAKTYFASELRKQLNVVDNWSWCGIHSSLSEAALSPSRGGWTAHTCVKVRFSTNLWLYIETDNIWYIRKRMYPPPTPPPPPPTKGKELSAQKTVSLSSQTLNQQTDWNTEKWDAEKLLRYFTFKAECHCVDSFDQNASNSTLLNTRSPITFKAGTKKLSYWLQRK